MQGLSVSRVVDVEVSFAPIAAPLARFDTLLIMGDSTVVDTGEAMREYNTIEEVAGDFGTTAPEFLAAELFFSQVPKPTTLFIGRWARTPTSGRLTGGPMPSEDQVISNWTSIINGGFQISVDGGPVVSIVNMDFSLQTNLNGIATIINAAFAALTPTPVHALCTWTGHQFIIQSTTTGPTSSVSFLLPPPGAPATATDISDNMLCTAALAQRSSPGVALETPVDSVVRVDGRGWYSLIFAASAPLTDAQHLAVCGYIEAASDKHLYGITTAEATCIDPVNTTDIGSQCSLADYMRTAVQYCATNSYAMASFFGRALTVNFEGSNTTITMKFKVQPGIIPELLSATSASTLASKRINVYAQYNNGTSIIEEGVMSGRAYFDEMHGLDWLANRIQTDVYNVLYQSPKIPQTDPGIHVLVATTDGALSQGVTNGLIAPGRWNAPGFGQLGQGDLLSSGWYTFAASVDTQDQAQREARIAPLIQVAVKLAGAVHFSNVLINVNR
jgi:hypothetical protein